MEVCKEDDRLQVYLWNEQITDGQESIETYIQLGLKNQTISQVKKYDTVLCNHHSYTTGNRFFGGNMTTYSHLFKPDNDYGKNNKIEISVDITFI